MTESPSVYVPGCSVEYRGPTIPVALSGSRDPSRPEALDRYRAAVPFQDGPDAAAELPLIVSTLS